MILVVGSGRLYRHTSLQLGEVAGRRESRRSYMGLWTGRWKRNSRRRWGFGARVGLHAWAAQWAVAIMAVTSCNACREDEHAWVRW